MKQTFKPVSDYTGYIAQTNELYKKISQVSKDISYLDVYNIVDVVTDKNTLSAKMNALTPNSSLVINTDPFYLNLEFYNTGDIILKNSTGNTIHISAQPGGIYYPVKIEPVENNSKTYQIAYKYSQSRPSIGSKDSVGVLEESTLAETIIFNNLEAQDTEASYVYGVWEPMSYNDQSQIVAEFPSYSFNKNEKTVIIQPQIQFWLTDENKNAQEQLFIDFELTSSNNTWVVSIDALKMPLNKAIKEKLESYDSYDELSAALGQDTTEELLRAVWEVGIEYTTPYNTWFSIIQTNWNSLTNQNRYIISKILSDVKSNIFIKVK